MPVYTLYILVAMGEYPQTYMIKARIAPRSGASAMLHTFTPRPAAAALAALPAALDSADLPGKDTIWKHRLSNGEMDRESGFPKWS